MYPIMTIMPYDITIINKHMNNVNATTTTTTNDNHTNFNINVTN